MPIACRWDGEHLVPLRPKEADKMFVIGQVHWLEEEQPRNMPQHRACFANIRDLWKTLPHHLEDEFPSPEALRARALIDAGYCSDRRIDAGSKAGAERIAAYVRGEKPFASVVIRGTIVIIREAESQSVKHMGADRFKKSMNDVLDVIAGIIGVPPQTVEREAGQAA